ncbi:MAG: hypothetical protein IKC28_12420 [Clostridia bacterium]|nr:hypothetical protein [Clostridia bacterium]
MNSLWLEHYCHPDCEPLKNIMRLPRAQAFALAKQLSDAHPETTAFYRFADFSNYYPRRLKTDALLHEMFVALGGQPKQAHPLSFVLGSSDYLHEWFGAGKVLRIPLSAVAPESITFTLGDSMSTLSREGSLTMLTMPMLAEAVRQHPGGGQGWLKETLQSYGYIEVQIWDDDALPKDICR